MKRKKKIYDVYTFGDNTESNLYYIFFLIQFNYDNLYFIRHIITVSYY